MGFLGDLFKGKKGKISEMAMHQSIYAHRLKCKHCGEFHGTNKWPLNGDTVAFYNQKDIANYSLKVTCPHCNNDWYVVWDRDPGQIQPLSVIRERKSIHDPEAIKRDITFTDSGEASAACCWNCNNFSILPGGKRWCREDMIEVDRKDLCSHWRKR